MSLFKYERKYRRYKRGKQIRNRITRALSEANPHLDKEMMERELRKKGDIARGKKVGKFVAGFLTCLVVSIPLGSPFLGSLVVFALTGIARLTGRMSLPFLLGTLFAVLTSIGL